MKHILAAAAAGLLSCTAASAQNDLATQSGIQQALDSPYCKNVHVSVERGVVTLTGTVDLYVTKLFAEKKASETRPSAIHNEIRVAGPNVSDRQLRATLQSAIDSRNIPGAAQVSRWIAIRVRNGEVTLSGHTQESTLSAVSMAIAKVPGVKNMILKVRVYSDTLPNTPAQWPPEGESVGGVSVSTQ